MAGSAAFSPDIAKILDALTPRETDASGIQGEDDAVQLVVFLIQGGDYAFFGESILEIVPVQTITFVPGMPACVPGVTHIRGSIESVLDMRHVLGLPPAPLTSSSRIVLGQAGDVRSGVLVDSVEDVLDVPNRTIHEPKDAPHEENDRVRVMGETDYYEHRLIILDIEHLFEMILTHADRTDG